MNLGKYRLSKERNKRILSSTKRADLSVSSFDSDYLRVSSCASFRRLQDKTQLFPMEKHDYARSRLTHSCEVAAVGKSLCYCVSKRIETKKITLFNQTPYFLSSIVPTCCLLHDIGNPPFGHFGEQIIRDFFKNNWDALTYISNKNEVLSLSELFSKNSQEYNDFVNFDGNAQTLRCVTKLECFSFNQHGLNLTSGVLGGLIKYPYSSIKCNNTSKFGYFKSEEDTIEFLKSNSDYYENHINPIALLMEAADDISMFCSDAEDAINKGCISYDDIIKFKGKARTVVQFRKKLIYYYESNINKGITGNVLLKSISSLLYDVRRELIVECAKIFVEKADSIINNKREFIRTCKKHKSLIELTSHYAVVSMFDKLKKNKTYNNRQIIIPEIQGKSIIECILTKLCDCILKIDRTTLFEISAKNYDSKLTKLISTNYLHVYKDRIDELEDKGLLTDATDCYERLHLIVDEISGMTDSYAFDIYNILKS